ncbi:YihY/virulence factor BrkB family protein [Arthrobacter mobilis]|uniref:YihY/virulence factor BrkB family protein n=1 Tax=Arthrobacter mobilis TaxID=2724944 RepID=A0A7X6K4G8_9MICC|nr:YihY/virulence factor BrkB family protein [Arthrobacter mobilis]NKX53214.1 YihY/virulence factor BrkB family protein [Arthrobacter mobilis]
MTQTPVREQKGARGGPHPLDRQALTLHMLRKRRALLQARRAGGIRAAAAWFHYLAARFETLRPVRAWRLYDMRHGPLMAAGSAYNMFFSVAAMLVAGFSVFGIIVSGNRQLQKLVVDVVNDSTPGLINTGGGGLATPEQLFSQGGALGVTLAVSLAAMVLTALRWIASLREGMRGVFDLPPLEANPVLVKLKDSGTLLVLAVALVITTAVAAAASTVLDLVVDLLRLDAAVAGPLTRTSGILVMLLLDMLVAVILFRAASGLRMPRPVMFQAALIAGVGSTVLRYFASVLLASVSRNPLLAPFAVILGLFVWFYFLSQLYLLATAWGALGKADAEARRHLSRRARRIRRHSWALRRGTAKVPAGGPLTVSRWDLPAPGTGSPRQR